MEARVIFDTGSEHLAVTGSLCNNKTAGKYRFYQETPYSKFMTLETEEYVDTKEVAKAQEEVKSLTSGNEMDVQLNAEKEDPFFATNGEAMQ